MQHLPPIPDNLPQLGVESAEASSDQQQHDQPENTDQILAFLDNSGTKYLHFKNHEIFNQLYL